jgi:hypothetical protein
MREETWMAAVGNVVRRGAQTLLLGLALLLVNPAACDDAPGCAGGCGGCSSKKAIRDFEYHGPSCLAVTPNDCTFITVEFYNDCSGPATFGSVEVPAGGGYDARQSAHATGGGYTLCPASGTCSGTDPSNETVVLDGTVDGQPVQIRFFVTGEQC